MHILGVQDSVIYSNQVYIQKTYSEKDVPEGEYAVNALHNLALCGVFTSHLFYANVDFWESKNLYKTLHSSFVKEQLSQDSKLALVVPAFQIAPQCHKEGDCQIENMVNMPKTKEELIKMVKRHKPGAFDVTNRGGYLDFTL